MAGDFEGIEESALKALVSLFDPDTNKGPSLREEIRLSAETVLSHLRQRDKTKRPTQYITQNLIQMPESSGEGEFHDEEPLDRVRIALAKEYGPAADDIINELLNSGFLIRERR